MPSAYCRAFRTGKGADRPASEKSPFCTGFIGRSSALLLRRESADERSIPRFPLFETALCLGFSFFLPCEIIIGWITDDFPPCQTTLCRGLAFFPSCEIIIGRVTDDFPLCETTLCRGLAFFSSCETTFRQGSADFPPCETFVWWGMKEFPRRKVIRDGYEIHCLPAIHLETVTDRFLAIAISLEILTDEIATLTKQLVNLTEEIATLQSSP